jgi:protein-L-isoaspartate(D-aspartate) O-methyltransferase
LLFLLFQGRDTFSAAREKMIKEQIEARGIHDASVLATMRNTPRHLFTPAPLQAHAYADGPLPIGHGATISQPFVVAWMTNLLQAAKTHRVLEVGTGSGYQAAVLSPLVQSVYTIEVVPELAQSATKRLAELGYSNVTVREGDGYRGWPDKAPFDRIILTAAPEAVPKTLLDQLAPGGRLVAPVGKGYGQSMTVVDKTAKGELRYHSMGGVAFVPMVPR